jgi:uncharacterized protein (DUF2147 family)
VTLSKRPKVKTTARSYSRRIFTVALITITTRGKAAITTIVLYGLRPVGLNHWNGGTLYNPGDGRTYGISAKRPSPDARVARICVGMPLFGETETLQWVSQLSSIGRC